MRVLCGAICLIALFAALSNYWHVSGTVPKRTFAYRQLKSVLGKTLAEAVINSIYG
jgi:hypothetical protein